MATRRKVTIYLYDGDDLAELQSLRVAAADAEQTERNETQTLAEVGAADARDAYNAFLVEARGRADRVVLQALPRSQWRELVRAHEPREKTVTEDVEDVAEDGSKSSRKVTKTIPDPADVEWGVNDDTFPDALVPLSIVEPEGLVVDDLSEPDFDRLYVGAFMLNRQAADPKALPAFEATPESDET